MTRTATVVVPGACYEQAGVREMASEQEVAAMRRALELAVSPDVPTGPNPRVGAVILDDHGNVVGEGFHRGAGSPHAEVDALSHAGERAHGGTAVVTLEPCDHEGRTGPCAAALLSAGITKVVFAQPDSTQAARGGAERLAAQGVQIESGLLYDEALSVNEEFSFAMREGRPFVTCKFAATLDGRVSAIDRTSRWITGEQARSDVHRLRSEVDAIAVGTGTVLSDDPHLTVRTTRPKSVPPLRVVVGRREVPPTAHVLDASAPTLQLATHDPAHVMTELFGRDVHHLLVEGGPTLAGAFFRSGLVNRVVAYLAPALLGSGLPAVADLGVTSMENALRLQDVAVEVLGSDVRVSGTVPKAPSHEVAGGAH